MDGAGVLEDGFERVRGLVHDVVQGISAEDLHDRLDGGTNSIAWLVWHLTRIQDAQIADVAGQEEVWAAQDWRQRFDLPLPPGSTGFGHTARDVAKVRVETTDLLTGYYDAVHEETLRYLGGLGDADLERVVDESWSPPVTLGVRLMSTVSDDLQHAGQAAFLRGVLRRR